MRRRFPRAFGRRVNRRNGYRERPFDMRAGSVALAVPKLQRLLLPRLAAGAPATRRTRPGGGRGRVLRARRLDAPRRRPGQDAGHREHLEEPGLGDGPKPRLRGRRLPLAAPRRGPLHLPVARRPRGQGARGGTHLARSAAWWPAP